MKSKKKINKVSYLCFRVIRGIVKFCYPRIRNEYAENIPDEPCIVVGNHTKMNGPISCELYFPSEKYSIWCASEMMELKKVPAYAYKDFWSGKPRGARWLYKILSYLIAPFSVCVFNNAHVIPVHRDIKAITTFKTTVRSLEDGHKIVIFPECLEEHNHIVHKFQDKFIDVASLYYKKTGKELSFVPMYIAPELKAIYYGKPVRYDSAADINSERLRICEYLMNEITSIAEKLPEHLVVPYNNVSRRHYKSNRFGIGGDER